MKVETLVCVFTLLMWLTDAVIVFCCWKLKEVGWFVILLFFFKNSYRYVRSKNSKPKVSNSTPLKL